jgi:hypothetical protein
LTQTYKNLFQDMINAPVLVATLLRSIFKYVHIFYTQWNVFLLIVLLTAHWNLFSE